MVLHKILDQYVSSYQRRIKSVIRLGNNKVLKTLTKTSTFVDADANANGSTIALREHSSGKLKTYTEGTILAVFDLQVTLILPTSLPVNWPLHSEVQNFQDADHGCNLGFSIRMILATFDLQVTPILPLKEKKSKIDFQDGSHGGHLGFQI